MSAPSFGLLPSSPSLSACPGADGAVPVLAGPSAVVLDTPTPAAIPAGRPTTAVAAYGLTCSLDEACDALGISRTTAKRLLKAGRFPVPPLPRKKHCCYRFSSARLDTYLSRAEDGLVFTVHRGGRRLRGVA